MLNKQICQKCKRYSPQDSETYGQYDFLWLCRKQDAEPFVTAYYQLKSGADNPPEWCPYALEHIVSAEQK